MINILLGGAMHKLPGRNFARFILALFTLYAIIIRNSYQGALFNFMRMDEHPQEVESLNDMLINNFEFYGFDTLNAFMNQVDFNVNRINSLNIQEFQKFRHKFKENTKLALLTSEDHVAYWNKIGFPNDFFTVCQEKITAINLGIYFRKDSCLISAFSNTIFEMTDTGLMDVYRVQTIDKIYLKRKYVKREPDQLRMRHIRGGNFLIQIGLVFSVAVFLGEVAYERLWKRIAKELIRRKT